MNRRLETAAWWNGLATGLVAGILIGVVMMGLVVA